MDAFSVKDAKAELLCMQCFTEYYNKVQTKAFTCCVSGAACATKTMFGIVCSRRCWVKLSSSRG